MRLARAGSSFFSHIAGASVTTLLLACGFLSGCSPVAEDCDIQKGCGQCDPKASADPVSDRCGLFVSRTMGSDDNEGSKGKPLRSLGLALKRAGERGAHVFACAETFEESVSVPAGVKIFGGLSCENGFAFVSDEHKTIIAPARPQAMGAMLQAPAGSVVAMTLDGSAATPSAGQSLTTRLENLVVKAPDGAWPLGSSVALLALENADVDIQGCTLIAGRGAPGPDAQTPISLVAQSGIGGAPGMDACSFPLGKGGASPSLSCGVNEISVGGAGGNGAEWNTFSGGAGLPSSPGAGLGGAGENANSLCQDGMKGADGEMGEDGVGASGMGFLSDKGFVGIPGALGQFGKPGQGGGGGGGSLSRTLCLANFEHGAGGGSGGTGGCGGMGGLGGGFGGASIGLVSLSAQVRLHEVSIQTAGGGDGGRGGAPQEGGMGGYGGAGGMEASGGVAGGCMGGEGGRGGRGGYGGGGLGGPSVGIAFVKVAPIGTEQVDMNIAKAGRGGRGGAEQSAGKIAGQDGIWAAVAEFPVGM